MTAKKMIMLSAIFMGTPVAHAQTAFERVEALDALAVARAGAPIGAAGGPAQPIDRRLKLAKCPQTPTADAPAMGAIAIRCRALGWRIRVPLIATEVIHAQPATILIKRGDLVQVAAKGEGFEVSTYGVAMDEGAMGKIIRVKSLTGNQQSLGLVSGPGSVEVSE